MVILRDVEERRRAEKTLPPAAAEAPTSEEIKASHNFERSSAPAVRAVRAAGRSVAATDSTVLILGETGNG
jgi:DNA-binding NtrC family response regulator